MANIVQNKKKGYGYKYSSLSSLAEAGIPVAKMRVSPLIDGNGNIVITPNGEPIEYVEYLDGDTWVRGARVVIPGANKGMNEAQAYGAALTYSRRYTVMMAEGVACTDDELLETTEAPTETKTIICEQCKKPITNANGMTVEQIADYTKKKYKKELCATCAKEVALKMKEDAKAKRAKDEKAKTNEE